VRNSNPLTVYKFCGFWLASCVDGDFKVFLINTRRTGIDAATMVIAVSAVARIMMLTVATGASISTSRGKAEACSHTSIGVFDTR
jgi:hypothetical protein